MAAIFLVLFLVTFLFDTRIGLFFLALAIVTLYRGASAKTLTVVRGEEPPRLPSAWKDPWGPGRSSQRADR
jgi:hypothetical protein